MSLHALENGTTTETALSFYDSLPAVAVEQMIGAWRGSEIPTGHPFDGLLRAYGWHGKRFDSIDECHPLVFDAPGDRLMNVNPALFPVGLLLRCPPVFHHPLLVRAFRLARPALRTSKPKARLRMMEYRRVVTATMSYDDLPIHDALRSVDPDTVMGAMDLRGLNRPFLFALRRET